MKDYYYEPISYSVAKCLSSDADENHDYYLINDVVEIVLVSVDKNTGERSTIRLDEPAKRQSSDVQMNSLFDHKRKRDYATPAIACFTILLFIISIALALAIKF